MLAEAHRWTTTCAPSLFRGGARPGKTPSDTSYAPPVCESASKLILHRRARRQGNKDLSLDSPKSGSLWSPRVKS